MCFCPVGVYAWCFSCMNHGLFIAHILHLPCFSAPLFGVCYPWLHWWAQVAWLWWGGGGCVGWCHGAGQPTGLGYEVGFPEWFISKTVLICFVFRFSLVVCGSLTQDGRCHWLPEQGMAMSEVLRKLSAKGDEPDGFKVFNNCMSLLWLVRTSASWLF